MNVKKLPVTEFIKKSKNNLIIDVRSPSEFITGHMENAVNIPLFDDDERKEVGTLYKRTGQREAFLRGLKIVEPKLQKFVLEVMGLMEERSCQTALVHCWRGGHRSQSFAWLLNMAGIQVFTLEGGYKSFRNHVLDTFKKEYRFILLGGQTGTGKTDILKELERAGDQMIDLEGLANHKGSVFGGIGQGPQPTMQQFENTLAEALNKTAPGQWIWLENESPVIGSVAIPMDIRTRMKQAPILNIHVPEKDRQARILKEYGSLDPSQMEEQILKLKKHLGGENCKKAVEALQAGNIVETAEILLRYYDKTYNHYLKKNNRGNSAYLELPGDNPEQNARLIKESVKKNNFWTVAEPDYDTVAPPVELCRSA